MAKPKPAQRPKAAGGDLARYMKLIRRFPLRPLQSDADLDEAEELMHELLRRESSLTTWEKYYFEVLCHEVNRFEQEHHAIPDATDVAVLAFLMDQHEKTQSDVAQGTGIPNSTLSNILRGKRKMNRSHIEQFAQFFQCEPGLFLPAPAQETTRDGGR